LAPNLKSSPTVKDARPTESNTSEIKISGVIFLKELLNLRKKAKSISKSLRSSNFFLHGQILGGASFSMLLAAKYSDACGSVKKTIE